MSLADSVRITVVQRSQPKAKRGHVIFHMLFKMLENLQYFQFKVIVVKVLLGTGEVLPVYKCLVKLLDIILYTLKSIAAKH